MKINHVTVRKRASPCKAEEEEFLPKKKKIGEGNSFTCFQELPTDVRLKIWNLTLPGPRVVEICSHPHTQWNGHRSRPSILYVCSESRKEALKSYTAFPLRLPVKPSRGCVYVNFQIDTLYFSDLACGWVPQRTTAPLKYFEEQRVEPGRNRNSPISDYYRTLKNSYPDFVENARADYGIAGHVPGVEVGLTVRYRDELRLLGLHRDIQKGIDSKNVRSEDGWHNEHAALSVVVSRGYKDGCDHGDVIIYVGEGGRDEKLKQQVKNQTGKSLGNVALKNNCFYKRPVRVIRNRTDPNSPGRHLYSYDGLYQVEDWEYIKGLDGFKVFRFKLVREPNQNALVWPDREPKPFVGQAARREAIARGKKVVEESAPEEAVPEDEISEGKVSSNGSEDIADATTLKESEKDTVGKSDEDQDDFSIGDESKEGGDCIVHDKIDQAIVQE